MQVVLLQDVKSLGKKGEIVKVNDGYARNYIIPKKLGVEANATNLNDLKLQKAHEAKVAKELLEAAKELARNIEAGQVNVSVKTGEGGKVFGSVSGKEIAAAAKEQLGIELDKKKFALDDAIKTVGVHEVLVKLHKDVTAKLKVNVTEA
ncbi:MAG: 50S ribosomal protein L9 [Lachnospiraceae bacterium]|nr:50S ribosomal protein L9 [Lachnospiraceae bacterium]